VITAAPAIHAQVPACRSEVLRVRLGPGNGAAGTIYFPIVFTNSGTVRCSLRGFPGVSSVDAAGRQVGSPARWEATVKVRTVVLAPHASASATYGQAQALNYPRARCHPVSARGLRVYPPNETRSRVLVSKHLACSSTRVGDSSVRAVVPGVSGQSA
jgi:Domain of unknown function (DUF4232)